MRAALSAANSARVEVYLRSLSPPAGAKDGQVARLREAQTLVETTPVDDLTVDVWGERICLCDTCADLEAGTAMRNTVRELESWGGEYDASAAPFFERREQESWVTETTYECIVPPRLVVACYVDGQLWGVFPSRFGDVPRSVQDFYEVVGALAEPDSAVGITDLA